MNSLLFHADSHMVTNEQQGRHFTILQETTNTPVFSSLQHKCMFLSSILSPVDQTIQRTNNPGKQETNDAQCRSSNKRHNTTYSTMEQPVLHNGNIR